MKQCTCYALRAIDCTCKPAQYGELYTSPTAKQEQGEPVAWRDHVEQRLLTWRQSFVNRSGDQLALDDFMDKESLDDLLEYVLDEYTTPQPAPQGEARGLSQQKPWVGLTIEDAQAVIKQAMHSLTNDSNTFSLSGNMIWVAIVNEVEAKLKEKNI